MTLQLKCAGLDAADLARRSVEPSPLSLLGLVRHMAEVERGWFRRGAGRAGRAVALCTAADPDGDFDGAQPDPALVTQAFEVWRGEMSLR